MNIREWLNEAPPPEIIAKLKDGDREVEYIPIGQVENMLDEAFDWHTENFKFQIVKTGNYWFATGSIQLRISASPIPNLPFPVIKWERLLTGAATIIISSKDDNMHYESTVLSLATANAAQKLGKRFGRELNGRMEVGETSFVNKTDEAPVIDRSIDRLKILIENAPSLQALGKHKEDVAAANNEELNKLYMSKIKVLSS
jgi:hypothetical protein